MASCCAQWSGAYAQAGCEIRLLAQSCNACRRDAFCGMRMQSDAARTCACTACVRAVPQPGCCSPEDLS